MSCQSGKKGRTLCGEFAFGRVGPIGSKVDCPDCLAMIQVKRGTWYDANRWACECIGMLTGASVDKCCVCGSHRPEAPQLGAAAIVTHYRRPYEQATCGTEKGGDYYTNLRGDTTCEHCLAMFSKTKTKTAECDFCWGTGYYHGHGGPCSKGCKSPSEGVGLADIVKADTDAAQTGRTHGFSKPENNGLDVTFQNPGIVAELKGEYVNVLLLDGRIRSGKIVGGMEFHDGTLKSIRLQEQHNTTSLGVHGFREIVRIADTKTIWRQP